ncbi:MAG: PspC domain-containing protein [Flavobacteriales bacterium]
MNKTISINLGGSVFNVEEDAFLLLRTYLESIKGNFVNDPARDEIMQDIEVRIAELFHERMNDRKNVVIKSDVDEVVAIMGQPEDYKVDSEDVNTGKTAHSNIRHSQRKLYRDADDKVLAGVCAGLSHYFSIDPIIIRLIVVLLFFVSGGSAILGYIIMWALVPKAETTAEKLKMRGEPVDVSNITRMVTDEAKAAAGKATGYGQRTAEQMRSAAGGAASGVGKAITLLFGLFITLIGFALLIGLLVTFIISDINFFGYGVNGFETLNQLVFQNDGTLWLLSTGLILAVGAPAVALIYLGLKIITGSTKKIKGLGLSLLALFIIGVITCIYGALKTAELFGRSADITITSIIQSAPADTLYIEVWPDTIFSRSRYHRDDFSELTWMTDSAIFYGQQVNLQFEPTNEANYKIQVIKQSQGSTLDEARKLCKNIWFDYEIKADSLLLGSYITTPKQDVFRAQTVDIVVYVPIGNYVKLGSNVHNIHWRNVEGEVLLMEEGGFESEDNHEYNEHRHHQQPDIHIRDTTHSESHTITIDNGNIRVKQETVTTKKE